jgi:hypothetical protein
MIGDIVLLEICAMIKQVIKRINGSVHMTSNEDFTFLRNLEARGRDLGIIVSHEYKMFILEEFQKNPDLDIEYYFIFENRIKLLEERIGYKLPDDFVEFFKAYDGLQVVDGEWFQLEDISLAKDFDIINFQIIEERPDLLSEEDCNHIIPLLSDNDAYVVMDLREDGKGVFVIWSDEEELAFQKPTFGEFIENIKEEIQRAKEADDQNFSFNYIEKYEYNE